MRTVIKIYIFDFENVYTAENKNEHCIRRLLYVYFCVPNTMHVRVCVQIYAPFILVDFLIVLFVITKIEWNVGHNGIALPQQASTYYCIGIFFRLIKQNHIKIQLYLFPVHTISFFFFFFFSDFSLKIAFIHTLQLTRWAFSILSIPITSTNNVNTKKIFRVTTI